MPCLALPRVITMLAAAYLCFGSRASYGQTLKRPFTVADSIEMTTIVDPDNLDEPVRPVTGSPAKRSPDGRYFALIVMRGDPITGVIEYKLLLYESSTLFSEPAPRELLGMNSTSSRGGISRLTWSADSRHLAFLGEKPHELPQLYVIDVNTKVLSRLTDARSLIRDYDITPDLSAWIYSVKPSDQPVPDEMRERGYAVDSSDLSVALHGVLSSPVGSARDLYLGRREWGEAARKIQAGEEVWFAKISPNGRYAVESLPARTLPPEWDQYEGDWLKCTLRSQRKGAGLPNFIHQLYLLDLASGSTRPLLNAPGGWSPQPVSWTDDGKQAVLFGSFLPLSLAAQQSCWKSGNVVLASLESDEVASLKSCPAGGERIELVSWDPRTETLLISLKRPGETGYLKYHRHSGIWKAESPGPPAPQDLDLRIVEGLNQPPQLQAVDLITHRSAIVSDFNPQLSRLTLGVEKVFEWSGKDTSHWKGGLYYPPNYRTGSRYPLVIQTHGFPEDRFEVSGSYPTAMAAQALANRDIMVLQLDGPAGGRLPGSSEAQAFVSGVEGAIDKLSEMHLVDPSRVGLIGFSRTGWYVEYFLTHSRYPIAAATAADNVDQGYVQYLFNSAIGVTETENLYGAPFWIKPERWLREAPGFNLKKIRTPLRLEVESDGILFPFSQWEMFSGLKKLKKPVDLIYIPDAPHLLVRPWHRLTSQGGNVDWFSFWLKSEEDPDPKKREQYDRWHKLRNLQSQQEMIVR
jgi:dipeptidyl aminopeptidase/acylaminoacyl peptidase